MPPMRCTHSTFFSGTCPALNDHKNAALPILRPVRLHLPSCEERGSSRTSSIPHVKDQVPATVTLLGMDTPRSFPSCIHPCTKLILSYDQTCPGKTREGNAFMPTPGNTLDFWYTACSWWSRRRGISWQLLYKSTRPSQNAATPPVVAAR